MRRWTAVLAALLAACGSSDGDEEAAVPPTAGPSGPTAVQLAALDSRDCRTVAEGYADALEARMFDFAAQFWSGRALDARKLQALYDSYAIPELTFAEVFEEGAAGTLYCTVTGALGDRGNPSRPLREGKIVLRRANDVPGATPEQLRWTIRSSTFIEPMERVGEGEPA